jgi:purine-binding chemotaxis protein CheW
MNSPPIEVLAFKLDGQRYGLPLSEVERVVRAAEVTPLPKAPAVVLGVLDVSGTILPVLSMRRRLRLPERGVQVTDQFLIARMRQRTVALVIDEAREIYKIPEGRVSSTADTIPGLEHIKGIAILHDGMVLIYDLESFLSLEEAAMLAAAMLEEEHHAG